MLKQAFSYVATIIIVFLLVALVYFLFFINDDLAIRTAGAVLAALAATVWFYHEFLFIRRVRRAAAEPIRWFALITREGEREIVWRCGGMTSFLIGKGADSRGVDMDLSDAQYCDFISPEHATLNYSQGYWYVEDLNSKNGVGLKRKGEEYALRLKPSVSYKVDSGDIIYIAKTKILAK